MLVRSSQRLEAQIRYVRCVTMADVDVWVVRAGKGGQRIAEFESRGIIGVGFHLQEDASGLSRRELASRIGRVAPGSKQRVAAKAGALFRFVNKVSMGDIIIVPDGAARELLFGRVTSNYLFRFPPEISNWCHYREVDWIGRRPRDVLPEEVLHSLGSLLTIFKPKGTDALLALPRDQTIPESPDRSKPDIPQADEVSPSQRRARRKAEITMRRQGELVRGVFSILENYPEGFPARDVLAELERLVPPTEFENSDYPNRPGLRRYEKIARFSTIAPGEAGWLRKRNGVWTLTDDGRRANEGFSDPEALYKESMTLYREWEAKRPEVEDSDVEASIPWRTHAPAQPAAPERTPAVNVGMDAITTFDSTQEALLDLLKSIRSGKTQLPDFQRGWIWDDDHLRSLLASVSTSFPIGAVMMLEAGNPQVRFKPRAVQGVSFTDDVEPERLILDGQQRLTSLYQALMIDEPVRTRDPRGKEIYRWYYVDINAALDPNGDREEAMISVPPEKVVKGPFGREIILDLSTIEKECAAEYLPLSLLFDTARLLDWQMHYLQMDADRMGERLSKWGALQQRLIQPFQAYQIPLIQLKKATSKEAVCRVFEKVNTGGVPLTVFELLTATFAADNFNLREDWEARSRKLRRRAILRNLESNDMLQTITLLVTFDRKRNNPELPVSAKRKDVLELTLQEYQRWADVVTEALERVAQMLFTQKIFSARDVPYKTQLVPLAAILAELGAEAEADGVKQKLFRWYWCGVLGELYGSATETRFARDLPQVLDWVRGGEEPSTVVEANFHPLRLGRLKSRQSAAYKGIHALLMRHGAQDLRTGVDIDAQQYFDEAIDIHHIFPADWCAKNGITDGRGDSIINKTPLSAKTNRIIQNAAPSRYLSKLEGQARIAPDRMDQILATHVVDSRTLRSDDFEAFFVAREEALLSHIEQAMGKEVERLEEEPQFEAEITDVLVSDEVIPLRADATGVLIVEGETDEEFLRFAAEVSGRPELLKGIHIIPAGGATKLVEQALIIRKQNPHVSLLALIDKDEQGLWAKKTLESRFHFQGKKEVMTYADVIDGHPDNIEAEDLFPSRLLQRFVEEYGERNVLTEKAWNPQKKDWHFGFNAAGKDYIAEFIRDNALPADISRWVDLLEQVRSRLFP
jgi:hypothetical protein